MAHFVIHERCAWRQWLAEGTKQGHIVDIWQREPPLPHPVEPPAALQMPCSSTIGKAMRPQEQEAPPVLHHAGVGPCRTAVA